MKLTKIISLAAIFLLFSNIYHCRITKNQKRRSRVRTECKNISETIRKSKSVLSVDEMKKIVGDSKCGTAYSQTTIEELQEANKNSINPKNGKNVSEEEVDKVRKEIMDANEKFNKEKLPTLEKEIQEFQNNDQKNKPKFKFREIGNKSRFSNEGVIRILEDLKHSSCAITARYLSFYAEAGTRHTIKCNTRAVILSANLDGFCTNNQDAPIAFDGRTILYLRFAYI